jgi:predicted small metal-binding protein
MNDHSYGKPLIVLSGISRTRLYRANASNICQEKILGPSHVGSYTHLLRCHIVENGPNRTSTGRFCRDALCIPVMERFGPQGREEKMGRKFIDCREFPSEMNCTLALSADNEDELLEAAVQHAITVHGHEDTPDLRTMIRTAMRDGTPPVEAPLRAA